MRQVLFRDDKVNISNCAQLVFVALGAVVDNFEFELWMSILIALAPNLGDVDRERCQASGIIRIPKSAVRNVTYL